MKLSTPILNMYIQVQNKQFHITDELKNKILNFPTPTFLSGLINFPHDHNKPLRINRNPRYFHKILELYSFPLNYYCDMMVQIYKEYNFRINPFYEPTNIDDDDNDISPNKPTICDQCGNNMDNDSCNLCTIDINSMKNISSKLFSVYGKTELDDNLRQFYDDLHFYGFLPPVPIKKNYDMDTCMHNIKNGIVNKGLDYDQFIYYLQYLHGCLSGSFVLQSYLNEEWNDSDGDLDVFVQKHDYEYFCDQVITKIKYNYLNREKWAVLYETGSVLYENRDYYNPMFVTSIHKYMLNIETVEMISPTLTQWKCYNLNQTHNHIYHIFKLKVNNTIIDFIIVDYPPQYHIQHFDFDFNKIYFDGYFVNAFDWNAIHNKTSMNHDAKYENLDQTPYSKDMYMNNIEHYMNNLVRIKKYTGRGFYIYFDHNK